MSKKYKIISSVLTLLLIASIVGCETERIIFTGPYHIRFTESAAFEKESYSQPIEIEVHNVGPALDEDVVISYKISGDARENIDYVILDERGKVTIKKGEYFGYIKIQLINNANNILRNQAIQFTLQGTSTDKLEIGQGTSAIGQGFTFTIFDDCILGDTYEGKQGSTTIADIPITSTDCEIYTLANWNIGVFNTDRAMDLTFVDNGDNTITIPRQIEEELIQGKDTIQGSGSVNPITKQIQLTIQLVNFNKEEVTLSLIPD